MSDRRDHHRHLRAVEVITVTEAAGTDPAAEPQQEVGRSTADIAVLLDVAGDEVQAIRQVDGCMVRLHAVQHAKAQLKAVSASELGAAPEFRCAALGGEPA